MALEEEEAVVPSTAAADAASIGQSYNSRIVPWLSWDEWDHVRVSLFSSYPDAIEAALTRVLTWRSRGCIPPLIEVTADFLMAQRMDPFFGKNHLPDAPHSVDQIVTNLYSMAVVRLVNVVVEKKRKHKLTSIAEAAAEYSIPRMLIDIRHECSHRKLPALPLLRDAALQALDWLRSYYWDPQKNALSSPVGGMREKIDSDLRELTLRRFTVSGHRKKSRSIMNELVLQYNLNTSEVVSSLADLLLEVIPSLIENHQQECESGVIWKDSSAGWRTLINQISSMAQNLLLNLLTEVLDRVETQESSIFEAGSDQWSSLGYGGEAGETDNLCSLFAWLIDTLKSGTEAHLSEIGMSRGPLILILRRILMLAPWNKQLMDSGVKLAEVIKENFFIDKVQKFQSLVSSNVDASDRIPPIESSSALFIEQEESMREASQKLSLFGLNCEDNKLVYSEDSKSATISGKWSIAKSWSSCPIGMLPPDSINLSRVPKLSCDAEGRPVTEEWNCKELNSCACKRGPESLKDSTEEDSGPRKKRPRKGSKETRDVEEVGLEVEGAGWLIINGAWEQVSQDYICANSEKVAELVLNLL
ncbi:hypothetical protein SAY87_025553 [Trapa incisa]|uniref:Las1-like family protein n=1 Tax=Trapa incisa TaxID=236973 RepID=A0AAN7GB09_9MYRT|nr:hypothetical protein SAY87_025553 [Trapa incisa]